MKNTAHNILEKMNSPQIFLYWLFRYYMIYMIKMDIILSWNGEAEHDEYDDRSEKLVSKKVQKKYKIFFFQKQETFLEGAGARVRHKRYCETVTKVAPAVISSLSF